MAKRRRRTAATKAAPAAGTAVAPAATFSAEQVAALLSVRSMPGGQVPTPLPRTDPQVPFGPGVPLLPAPIDPLNAATGRAEPRIHEYPVTSNLPGVTDRLIPWKVLRDASEIPVVRDCIRIRKNEVTSLEWDIVVSKRALAAHRKKDPSMSSVIVERELRERLAPETDRAMQFWKQPDWQQGENFVEWATKLLEEHLVLDAVAIYPFRNRGGDKLGLRILDGSTIKILRDHLGGRPLAPQPAYQQLLWGFPRGEFAADVDEDGNLLGGDPAKSSGAQLFDSDRLIYKRREVRTITPYGYSAVEQSLQDVDLYLRRLEWDKAQYTDGVAPAGWLINDGMEQWTPQQLLSYNKAFNDLYSGQTLERMRYHLLPPGIKPAETADIPEKFKPDYHLHLIKLVAMHFDVTLAELGFTESKGLGSTGWHEGQENVQQRKATNPTLVWLQSLLTEIMHRYLGVPEELEFRFLGLDADDQAAADAVIHQQLVDGRITWNEAREEGGRAPYDFDEANMPVVQNGRGLVFVEGASKLAAPGEEIGAPQAPPINGDEAAAGDTTAAGENLVTPQAAVAAPQNTNATPPPAAVQPSKPDAAKTELAAYGKWLRNGRAKRRPFEFEHVTLTEAMLNEIDLDTVVFKAGGAGPKARTGQHWPAWDQDLRTAEHWAGELHAALSGVPTRTIASRWLEVRKDSTSDRRRDAAGWLAAIGWSVTSLVRRVLRGLWVDGFLLGNKAAQALLEEEERVDWGDWKPGSTAETRLLIAADGLDPGLQQLLTDADRIADGINATRVKDVAKVLADAVDTQPTVDELESQIADALSDKAAVDRIALTETSRAVADGALARYDTARLDGVTHLEWVTAAGACPRCQENAAAGPVPIGQPFPTGSYSPPEHPLCRCAVFPAPAP